MICLLMFVNTKAWAKSVTGFSKKLVESVKESCHDWLCVIISFASWQDLHHASAAHVSVVRSAAVFSGSQCLWPFSVPFNC